MPASDVTVTPATCRGMPSGISSVPSASVMLLTLPWAVSTI
jgi:hypothetical protein